MKKIFGIILISSLLLGAKGDDLRAFKFEGTVTDKSTGEILDAYIVEVFENNNIIQSPEVDKKGRFEANLFEASTYTIDVSLSGYYPKRVVVHTDVPDDIKKVSPFKFEIELIRKSDYEDVEVVDPMATSIFDFPYVIFEWDELDEDFTYRKSYTDHIKEKYAEVEDQL